MIKKLLLLHTLVHLSVQLRLRRRKKVKLKSISNARKQLQPRLKLLLKNQKPKPLLKSVPGGKLERENLAELREMAHQHQPRPTKSSLITGHLERLTKVRKWNLSLHKKATWKNTFLILLKTKVRISRKKKMKFSYLKKEETASKRRKLSLKKPKSSRKLTKSSSSLLRKSLKSKHPQMLDSIESLKVCSFSLWSSALSTPQPISISESRKANTLMKSYRQWTKT